jgi:peptidoglycan biosynthesis protein MviN/MurJ (putative lipid II flippase)
MKKEDSAAFISRRSAWLLLLVIVLVALAIVAAPVWIIQPFKPQTTRGLEISFALRRWSPLVTMIALAVALLLVGLLGRRSRWWSKGLLVLIMLPLLASTWFARQNHFEWMFNPLARSAYARPSEATFVGDNDMVLSVENNGEAVAYPVRLMAYHHLVQDVVGGTPIVATY